MGAQVRRKSQAYSQLLFGRERREGKDSHSRQWRLSMAVFLNRNKRPEAAPIEVAELLSEKPPPSPPSLLRIRFSSYAPAAELVDGALDSVLGVVPRLVLIAVVKFEREPLNVLFGAGEIVTGQACDHLHKG